MFCKHITHVLDSCFRNVQKNVWLNVLSGHVKYVVSKHIGKHFHQLFPRKVLWNIIVECLWTLSANILSQSLGNMEHRLPKQDSDIKHYLPQIDKVGKISLH